MILVNLTLSGFTKTEIQVIDYTQIKEAVQNIFQVEELAKMINSEFGESDDSDAGLNSMTDNSRMWDIFSDEVHNKIIARDDNKNYAECKRLQLIIDKATEALKCKNPTQEDNEELLLIAILAQRIWSKRLGFDEVIKEYHKEHDEDKVQSSESDIS